MPIGTVSDTLVVSASRGVVNREAVTQSVNVMSRSDIEALGLDRAVGRAAIRAWSQHRRHRPRRRRADLAVRARRRFRLQRRADRRRARQSRRRPIRFQPHRRRRDRSGRNRPRRPVSAVGRRRDDLGRPGLHETRRQPPTLRELSGSAEGGSFNTFRGNAGVDGGARGKADYRVGVTYRTTGGAFSDLLPEDDEYRQTAVDGGVGVALGTRATIRGGVRYSKARGHSVGAVTYGSRDTGRPTTPRSLHTRDRVPRGRVRVSPAPAPSTISATRACRPTPSPIRRTRTYAILTGTPNALFPNGTRLVRLIDQTEFNTPGRGRCSAGSGTVSRLARQRRLPVRQPHRVSPAFGALSGRLQLGCGSAPERRLRLGARDQSQRRRLRSRQPRVLRPAAVHVRRSLVCHGRPAGRQQGKLQHVRQPQAVGGRVPGAAAAAARSPR